MKAFALALAFFMISGFASAAPAAQGASEGWDGLIDVTYKFSWFPQQDLQDLLEGKEEEYGQSLEEYRDLLAQEVTGGAASGAPLNIDNFVQGKPWRKYLRLSLAEFSLFLAGNESLRLENARTAISFLDGKRRQPEVAFWHYLLEAYRKIDARDEKGFIASVFQLWQHVILELEVDNHMMASQAPKTGFMKSLPLLYENLAHVIIRKAILEKEMSELHPLGAIVLAMQDKLENENGYKSIVDPIAERMHGLNSDNNNLSFAVAFLEATASRYEFEDEQSPELIVEKFKNARRYYQLALEWADTRKGKAAIQTHYLGFLTYATRRLSDAEDLLAKNSFFESVPAVANNQLQNGLSLYDSLAKTEVQKGGYTAEGFADGKNYIKAMHRIWDANAKLSIMLSGYYRSTQEENEILSVFPAESPLLGYCVLFQKYARSNPEILPDNAFFLASYAAGELADLYRKLSEYSTDSQINDLAFAFQLQAVEIFPMDVMGVLQLAYHASQNGSTRQYFEHAAPVASHLKGSSFSGAWMQKNDSDHNDLIALVPDTVPVIIENAYSLLGYQDARENSEDALSTKTILMARSLQALKTNRSEEDLAGVLSALGSQDFSDEAAPLAQILRASLKEEVYPIISSVPGIEKRYQVARLKNELFSSLDSPVHGYLRGLYYETPYKEHQYVALMDSLRETYRRD